MMHLTSSAKADTQAKIELKFGDFNDSEQFQVGLGEAMLYFYLN